MTTSDQHGAGGHDGAGRQIGRVVAGQGRIAVAGGGFAVDEHGAAAELDGGLVARRLLKRAALGNVGGRVGGGAAKDGGRFALDSDVGAQVAVELAREGMRQRGRLRPAR